MAEIVVEVREQTIIGADKPALDEVVLWADGVCLFHLEQMSDNDWWMGVGTEENNGQYVHVHLTTKRAEIHGDWYMAGRAKPKLLRDGKEVDG